MSRKTLSFLFIALFISLASGSFLQEYDNSLDNNQVEDRASPSLQAHDQSQNSQNTKTDSSQDPPPQTDIPEQEKPWVERFTKSFGYSFLIIFTAELADKTFVMIIILAMTYGRFQIFLGASLALIIMHTLAVLLGAIVPEIFSQNYIKIGSIIVFTLFGLYLIYKGCRKKNKSVEAKLKKVEKELQDTGNIEHHQVQEKQYFELEQPPATTTTSNLNLNLKLQNKQDAKINERESSSSGSQTPYSQIDTNASSPQRLTLVSTKSEEMMMPIRLDQQGLDQPLLNQVNEQVLQDNNENIKVKKAQKKKSCWKLFLGSAFMKMFLIGLVSEMGDRSQITAVALGAANQMWGVIIGGSFGHVLCSLFGVWLGLIFMNRISAGKLIIFGGIVCLVFAVDIVIFG